MLSRLLANCALVVAFAIAMAPDVSGNDPDYYLPDSAYFGVPSFRDVCDSEVTVVLPVYIWSDYYSDMNVFQFVWQGNSNCDTVMIFVTGSADTTASGVQIDRLGNRIWGGSLSEPMFLCPTQGTQLFLQLIFSVPHGDSLAIEVVPNKFYFSTPIELWYPMYMNLNTIVHVPDKFVLSPGDADCSGTVTISDVVFLIDYIFSGGSPPHDLNAADADGSCSVTISDAVHLISYIFAGGGPPIPGCVR